MAQWHVRCGARCCHTTHRHTPTQHSHPTHTKCSEKDLDEVLQTTAVFSNVSKGILAKREDLLLAFGSDDQEAICKKILAEGELQISDKERKLELDTLFRDVASVLSEKCLNPENHRPYTISMLERALRDVHFSVDPKRPAKAQALEALPILKAKFPIERARMRLRIIVPTGSADEVRDLLAQQRAVIEEQDLHQQGSMVSMVCLVDPGAFRKLHSLVQGAGAGGRVEVVALAASAAANDESGESAFGVGARPQQQQQSNVIIVDDDTVSGHVQEQLFAPSITTTTPTTAIPTAVAVPSVRPRRTGPLSTDTASTLNEDHTSSVVIVHPRGPLATLPEEQASRRERFAELDTLQSGWTVELRSRGEGSTVEAVFFSPDGQKVGAFAAARRAALAASKQQATKEGS